MSPYVNRNGRMIAIEYLPDIGVPKRRRKPFQTKWVKLPNHWIETLRQTNSASTIQLALAILSEAFKRQQIGGEIVLSATVTKLTRSTRVRATKELVRLSLIEVEQKGRQAPRVCHLYYY